MSWKEIVRSLPVLGPLSKKLRPPRYDASFDGSADYWERRYRQGGNSGAGSYNRLAEFKAQILNDLVAKHQLGSVIEFGCGDGAQLELCHYSSYVGVDVSWTVIEQVRRRFISQPNFAFLHSSEVTAENRADLALSLDVIYHLVEDETFHAYMQRLFASAEKFVAIYASNKDDRSTGTPHVRHREFTQWVEKNRADFKLTEIIPNRYPFDPKNADETSFADFYIYRREGADIN